MTWHVYTDGSAITTTPGGPVRMNGKCRYPGGWAAVVEHGSDGYVIRGREADTTNVRMELRAAIEGLKEIPTSEVVTLHFDCTVIFRARDRWLRGVPARCVDVDLWVELGAQFDRLDVRFHLLTRPDPVHRRAHGIAQSEAKAQAAGLPARATVLSRIEKKDRRRAAEAALVERQRRDDIRRRQQVATFAKVGDYAPAELRHLPGCDPIGCVMTCPVFRTFSS